MRFAIRLKGRGSTDRDDASASAGFREVGPPRFSVTAAVAPSPVSSEDEFSFGLDLDLRGLRQPRDGE
ncbi:hypothetical protein OG226_41525 [Streptomyces sp. NBC_01261]|uniref:hypothetical protein n=1 Tax=Streptomyces sp. NBC_01261 TaxID=2903802 RepID=UPI002E2F6E2B|nr:hypothetical protein [Streptomyces sp. NBC_01261]